MPPEIVLRPAEAGDDEVLAAIHLGARESAAMPPGLHDQGEVRFWLARRLEADDVWIAEVEETPVGYARFTPTWLDDLYVLPDHAGQGIGTALLDIVKAQRPNGFSLWVFEMNHPARRFYRARGLVELEHTDGAANEEHSPDLRMAWPGEAPLAFFRRLIDEVDAELGDLLNRRAAITRAIQPHKDGFEDGRPTRDPDREREIARTIAARAPSLGEDRLTRIVHAIITESLDAAGTPD